METAPNTPNIKTETKELYNRIAKDFLVEESPDPAERDHTAILIATGGGDQNSRLEIDWKKYSDTVLVANKREDEGHDPASTTMLPHLTEETGKPSGDVYTEEEIPDYLALQKYHDKLHTGHQAEFAVEEIKKNPNINKIIISTAEYHLPRFVLTFAKHWLKDGDDRKLTLRILPTTPREHSEEYGTNLSPEEEMTRMQDPNYTNDVASSEEFDTFLKKTDQS